MIGNTPIVKINKLIDETVADIYVKLEGVNPAGSIKDRVALSMIQEAQNSGALREGMRIVEPTSGNTGIALAMIGSLMGYPVTLVMPETMSAERISLMKAYGADVVLTAGDKGMAGALEHAEKLCNQTGAYMPAQFDNPINTKTHYESTAREIIHQMPDIDVFVSGIGTGGTISGIGRALKEYNPSIQVIGVEPKNSAVINGHPSGAHKIQGIGAGFIPSIYDGSVVDEVFMIDGDEAVNFVAEISKKEGLMLGISSAANILASINIASEIACKTGAHKKVLTISPDSGYKYISSGIFG